MRRRSSSARLALDLSRGKRSALIIAGFWPVWRADADARLAEATLIGYDRLLLDALAEDLAVWLERLPGERRFLFAREDDALWHPYDWNNWRKRHFHAATEALDLGRPRPYDLRHSFASLRIRERGVSIVDLAAQLGLAPAETLKTYSHVYAEYRRKPPRPPDVLIAGARAVHGTRARLTHRRP